MHNSFLKLYIEINKINFIFFVVESDDQENFRVIYELPVPLEGIEDNRIIDSPPLLSFLLTWRAPCS